MGTGQPSTILSKVSQMDNEAQQEKIRSIRHDCVFQVTEQNYSDHSIKELQNAI